MITSSRINEIRMDDMNLKLLIEAIKSELGGKVALCKKLESKDKKIVDLEI